MQQSNNDAYTAAKAYVDSMKQYIDSKKQLSGSSGSNSDSSKVVGRDLPRVLVIALGADMDILTKTLETKRPGKSSRGRQRNGQNRSS